MDNTSSAKTVTVSFETPDGWPLLVAAEVQLGDPPVVTFLSAESEEDGSALSQEAFDEVVCEHGEQLRELAVARATDPAGEDDWR